MYWNVMGWSGYDGGSRLIETWDVLKLHNGQCKNSDIGINRNMRCIETLMGVPKKQNQAD